MAAPADDDGERSSDEDFQVTAKKRGAGRGTAVSRMAGAGAAAVLPLLVVAGLVGAAVASCGGEHPSVPDLTPPGAGAPLPEIDVEAPGRSAEQLSGWAAGLSDELGVSQTALEAYGYAQAVMAESRPGCHLGWTTVAGIGSVESKHGTHAGSAVGIGGQVIPPIRGVALDGGPGLATIPDTDGGALDGDTEHDRAVGPMQFIPETWERWGVDANGDGVADPDNIDDAALTTGRYLCANGRDLATSRGWSGALHSYNRSEAYARDVLFRANAYSVGVRP